ncbi:hypothetical protein N7510_002290 [Penicillium lagena]|uniref:uncharacterized protein n=1 Tax=Penicillium lagena TaxID=94218 RepID=UPI00254086F2|nr:uncharacterized protein N7510_002290 [Penicillium lagena]KAJ5625981.1 hypothetical protein N7510_002290 [Penicillium lagena]
MKFFQITAVAALVASAAAQGLSDLPSCAKSCALDALPKACGLDIGCICKTKSFINNMACCVEPACSKADQQKTLEAAKKICETGGVTDIPDTVVCDKGSTGSTTTTTATGSEATGNSTTAQTTASSASSASGSSTASGTSSSSSSSSAAAAATSNVAMLGQNKDGSLMAAAGAAAAFAILV